MAGLRRGLADASSAGGGGERRPFRSVAPFPWRDVMRFCLAHLHWSPQTMWQATPRELAAALAPPARTGAPERARLAALLRRYPD
ncbi:phage tail assembly chaperone [Breoghania corrubedonensis]|uniref:phage tail assembly chaperone n=1 Tax=Breoghania corrubedonensis TaxID=665038 RepID=UPI002481D301|nr:phage tail assembly chaperone [Breoghania corrubedonensis]